VEKIKLPRNELIFPVFFIEPYYYHPHRE